MTAVLLDQGLPRGAVRLLQSRGLLAEHVGGLGMAAASDEEILGYASDHGIVVVTLDSDFHVLLAQSGARRPSVIRLRVEGMKAAEAAELIWSVVERVELEIRDGAAVSASKEVVRVRRLPIGRGGR